MIEPNTLTNNRRVSYSDYTAQKATLHQVITALAPSIHIIFASHNQLLTTGRPTDDPSLAGARAIVKVSGHQHRWLACGYEL